jgi:2-polyprenyl-3-methyl-5-hydroxy-6-metoxy-1,4-benzoquinol methylase
METAPGYSPIGPAGLAIRSYFDDTVEYWDNIYSGDRFINWHMAERKKLVLDLVQRVCGDRRLTVLDLGCGTGVLTQCLMQMGHSVAALDCSENMIGTVARRLGGPSAGAFIGAVLSFAGASCFAAARFDLILCVGVVQYQRDPEPLFAEIHRLLKPGGTCIFTLPNLPRLSYLLDPVSYVMCASRLVGSLRRRNRPLRALLNNASAGSDTYHKTYFGWEIPALLRNQPLVIKRKIGFGYGPLTLLGKELLPASVSIALSSAIHRLARLKFLSWLPFLANRWAVVVEKPGVPDP